MENVEIEYKIMVKEADFKYLLFKMKENYANYNDFIQENVYFDTVQFSLKKNHLSLRIRNIQNKNQLILTLKESIKEGRLEHEFEVSNLDIHVHFDKIQKILEKYNISKEELIEVARLTTKRTQFNQDDGCICLDENFYYGQKDYEIECESTSMLKAKSILHHLCLNYQIPFQESKESKIHRAIKNKK